MKKNFEPDSPAVDAGDVMPVVHEGGAEDNAVLAAVRALSSRLEAQERVLSEVRDKMDAIGRAKMRTYVIQGTRYVVYASSVYYLVP